MYYKNSTGVYRECRLYSSLPPGSVRQRELDRTDQGYICPEPSTDHQVRIGDPSEVWEKCDWVKTREKRGNTHSCYCPLTETKQHQPSQSRFEPHYILPFL